VDRLLDPDSKRFQELGLRHAQHSNDRWVERLVDDPLLLRMPLVRFGNLLTVGPAEAEWKAWVAK
jgi:arsenate reductase-like glutaredoxin family protein